MGDDYVEHEEQYKGCRIRLMVDEDGDNQGWYNPRKGSPVGEIVYSSDRYVLGDRKVDSWESFFGEIISNEVIEEERLKAQAKDLENWIAEKGERPPDDSDETTEWDDGLHAVQHRTSVDWDYVSERATREELREMAERTNCLVPVYAHIHGSTELSTNRGIASCRWDSGQSGFIWCSLETAKNEFGPECGSWDDLCKNPEYKEGSDLPEKITLRRRTEDFLDTEVAEYNSWRNNRIVYYVADYLEDPEADPDDDDNYEEIDRADGYIEDAAAPCGKEYARALEDARSSVDHFLGAFSTWEEKRTANCVGASI